jgi:hypothetical protein
MIFIGDVHGKFDALLDSMEYAGHGRESPEFFQVGDMGLGFPGNPRPLVLPPNFRFIRGNHDNPDVCRAHPNYAGDYGYDGKRDIFWCGGAWSIDATMRMQGVTWWPDEELSIEQLNDMLDRYISAKPRIVATHDCPDQFFRHLFNLGPILPNDGPTAFGRKLHPTRTGQALAAAWDAHKPELWIFGHHHRSVQKVLDGTRLVCLDELETLEVGV